DIFIGRKAKRHIEVPICHCIMPDNPDEMACREGCLNRSMLMECSPHHCPMRSRCSNQQIQNRLSSSSDENLEVFRTPFCGFGLRTKVDIPRGALVTEYRGEVISQEECRHRMETMYGGTQNYYFLNYDGKEVVDAGRKGTDARFANHSCEPNCYIEKWSVGGEYRIGLYASSAIRAGTELTYDYRFEAFGAMHKCMCGANKCRGT
ncbi:structural basis of auto-inhibitory mechanism of histone methyltransferase, partial [Blyttiomyces helicus]